MISDRYQCVFVEVPKTGSTSIRSIIGQPEKPHLNIQEVRKKYFQRSDIETKNPVRHFLKKRELLAQWNRYFKFGFVRNPWDRVVSLYLRKEGIQMVDKMSFEEFVRWIQNRSDTCIHPSTHKNQLDWFLDERGEVAVDFIGKFENLSTDWAFISTKLGIEQELPHANKNPSKKKHYSEYYTDELRNIIADKFRTDIEYFDYRFGE